MHARAALARAPYHVARAPVLERSACDGHGNEDGTRRQLRARTRHRAWVALEGVLEPIWILPDTGTKAELKRAGLKLPDEGGYSIPLFAVFAGQNRLFAQGHSSELRELPATLDELL